MDEDIERLIEEVEKRPALYDKSLKEYGNTIHKKHLWDDIVSAVVPHYAEMDDLRKTRTGMEIMRKWQNLRNCFARELRLQKQEDLGNSAKKRRKYIYFDKLLFLLPSTENRETESNAEDAASQSSDCDVKSETALDEEITPRRHKTTVPRKRSFEEPPLEIPEPKKTTSTNEDMHFALSLVPVLQSLDDYTKMEAKIQIMNLLKSLKWPAGDPHYSDVSLRHQYPVGLARVQYGGYSVSNCTDSPSD